MIYAHEKYYEVVQHSWRHHTRKASSLPSPKPACTTGCFLPVRAGYAIYGESEKTLRIYEERKSLSMPIDDGTREGMMRFSATTRRFRDCFYGAEMISSRRLLARYHAATSSLLCQSYLPSRSIIAMPALSAASSKPCRLLRGCWRWEIRAHYWIRILITAYKNFAVGQRRSCPGILSRLFHFTPPPATIPSQERRFIITHLLNKTGPFRVRLGRMIMPYSCDIIRMI